MASTLQMNLVRALPLVAAISVVVVSSLSHSEEQQPQTTPTRDVDITYQITRLGQPAIVERRRWLASLQLRQVDGPDKSATIFDQNREELTLLNPANHTYRTVEWPVANRMSPQKGTTLKRGGESKIAGQNCKQVLDGQHRRIAHCLFDAGWRTASPRHRWPNRSGGTLGVVRPTAD